MTFQMPERLEKQMAYLLAHPEIDVVGGAIEEIDENSESRGKMIVYPEGPKECYEFFARRNLMSHPAVLFRKSFFDKAGCKYRPEYRQNQDTMLWVDGMSKGTKHANIPDVVLSLPLYQCSLQEETQWLGFCQEATQRSQEDQQDSGLWLWSNSLRLYDCFIDAGKSCMGEKRLHIKCSDDKS